MVRAVNTLASQLFNTRPVRYRSKTTGRYVSEEFAREHRDETYAVNRGASRPLALAGLAALLGLAVSAGLYYRSRP
jgi:hypothetical protein